MYTGKLVFATNNPNKIKEVRHLLPDGIDIQGLKDIGCHEELPETHETLRENAFEKADHVARNYGVNCFAEDTGFMVDALNGEPGVYSARYSGSRNMQANMDLLLKKMEQIDERHATFRTFISLIINRREYIFEGSVEGRLLRQPRGAGGFGYDPVFQPEGYEQTFAEMTLQEKGTISHRAKAVHQLITFLKEYE